MDNFQDAAGQKILDYPDAAGQAALSICESILLSLSENRIISFGEAKAILEDAATAHRNAELTAIDPVRHRTTAEIIERILANGNAVRRADRPWGGGRQGADTYRRGTTAT